MKIGASHITIYDVGANIRGFELTASFKHRCRHKNGSQGMVAANTICKRIPATSTKIDRFGNVQIVGRFHPEANWEDLSDIAACHCVNSEARQPIRMVHSKLNRL